MNNFKKYSIVISIIGAVIILVQILANHFNLSLDQNIIIEVVSVIIAMLISIGVIKKQSTNIKDIKEQVKQDLQNTTNPTQTNPTDTQTSTQQDNKTETEDK